MPERERLIQCLPARGEFRCLARCLPDRDAVFQMRSHRRQREKRLPKNFGNRDAKISVVLFD